MNNLEQQPQSCQTDVSGWRMFTVELTLNNGLKTKYISSMEGIDEVKAKEIAIKQCWISGVKSVDSVSFDACKQLLNKL